MNCRSRIGLAAAVAALAGGAVGGCGPYTLASLWPTAPIRVDGSAADWAGALEPLQGSPARIGVRNDADSLWLCLVVDDSRARRALVGGGLTVQITSPVKGARVVAVRYPLGVEGPPRPRRKAGTPEERGAASTPEERHAAADSLRSLRSAASLRRVELHSGEMAARVSPAAAAEAGVVVAVGGGDDEAVYELRLPLGGTGSYGILGGPGTELEIRLGSGRSAGGGPDGDRRGSFGPPEGPEGGGPETLEPGPRERFEEDGRAERFQTVEAELKVRLAGPPGPAGAGAS